MKFNLDIAAIKEREKAELERIEMMKQKALERQKRFKRKVANSIFDILQKLDYTFDNNEDIYKLVGSILLIKKENKEDVAIQKGRAYLEEKQHPKEEAHGSEHTEQAHS